MKICIENGSKMVLKDNQYRRFIAGLAFFAGGLAIAWFLKSKAVPLMVGLAFAAAGGFIFYTTRRVLIELDKTSSKIKIILKGFKRQDEREIGFDDIQKLVLRKLVRTSFTSSSRGRRSAETYYQYHLIFVTRQNTELPFDFGRASAGLANLIVSPDSRKQEKAQEIANFIGAPLEASLPTAGDVLKAIKDGIMTRAGASR